MGHLYPTHAIKNGKPIYKSNIAMEHHHFSIGKPSISMGHGLTMAMLVITRLGRCDVAKPPGMESLPGGCATCHGGWLCSTGRRLAEMGGWKWHGIAMGSSDPSIVI